MTCGMLNLSDTNEDALALILARARDGGLKGRPPDPSAALLDAENRLREMGRLCEALIDKVGEVKARAREAETRTQEMSHRIKNSLQSVASLLRVQSRGLEDDGALDALALAGGRIEAIARLHDLLCDDLAAREVRLDRYLGEVCGRLGQVVDADGGPRRLVVWAEPCGVSVRAAQALGLIVVETVLNAFRHGLGDGASGTVEVEVFGDGNGGLQLTVIDDGRGLPHGSSFKKGIGTGLVEMLAEQIGAKIAIGREDGGGTRFTLILPDLSAACTRGDGVSRDFSPA